MRILILGANSFIGNYYKKFSKFNKLFLTSSKKKKKYIKFNLLSDNIEYIISKYKITHLVFFAAISKPQDCQKNKKMSNLINVVKAKKVLNTLLKKKIYFVYISSDYIFNGKKGNYFENSKPDARVLYGKHKLEIENFLEDRKEENYSILRCPKTYGDDINDKSIFMSFLVDCFKKKNFTLAYDQIFSALYVKDLIKIIDVFLKKEIKGKFNVSGDESFSRLSYCKKILLKFNIKGIKLNGAKLKKLSKIKNIPLNVSLNNSKIKKKINFKFTKFDNYLNIIKKKYAKKVSKF